MIKIIIKLIKLNKINKNLKFNQMIMTKHKSKINNNIILKIKI